MRTPALPETARRMPRVLIAGREGQLAQALLPLFQAAGWDTVAMGRPVLDLAAPARHIAEVVEAVRPALVVNAAAWTAVDRAEEEPEAAMAVNGRGAGFLAAEAAACGAALLHVSTDYVFDGAKGAPYTEADPVAPLGAYGRSKLEGERRVLAANPRATVLRTAWVCSATGQNFLRTMLRLAVDREEVAVVADQRGAPIFAEDLAAAILRMAPALAMQAEGWEGYGVFHLGGAPDTTWHSFADAIFTAVEERGHRVPRLRAITTAEYPTPARRPADSRLDCARIAAVHGIHRPDWRRALGRTLDRLLGPIPVSAPVPEQV